jgi:hypothetical protein
MNRMTLPEDLTPVRRVNAGYALDKHGLAGAVIADQSGHLPGRHVEVHVHERLHWAEVLVDAPQTQEGLPGFGRRALGRVVL